MNDLRDVYVTGVFTTRFGKHLDRSLGSLACEAAEGAVKDAGLEVQDLDAVVFSNAAEGVLTGQEMIRGQVSLKGSGLEGLPLFNTENACASGGSAFYLAWLMVAAEQAGSAIAVGAEKLISSDKARSFAAIEAGTDLSIPKPAAAGSVMMGAYAAEARAYAGRYGDLAPAMAAVAVKNREFGSGNPAAQFTSSITVEEVLASREVADPLTMLMCSPLTDGAAAVVLSRTPSPGAVRVRHTSVVSSGPSLEPVVQRAADGAYASTGLGPQDVDLFQLHDACAFAEILQYEQVGIAAPGHGAAAALSGTTSLRGAHPVNTDGGLLSRGHPLGASGLAQVVEMTHQLRGAAGARQIRGATTAMAVNAGGWMGADYAAAVATMLCRVA